MPSSYTENYQLSQWEAEDRVQRTDFNSDNVKIDAALAQKANLSALTGLAKIATGSYTGTGEYGKNHPNTLTFPFKPQLVLIVSVMATNAADYMIAVQGQTHCCTFNTNGSGYSFCTWSGNRFSWYSTDHAGAQFNNSDQELLYVAIG